MRDNEPGELVDLTMRLHHQTDRAILVSDDGDRAKAVWLPVSQIEYVWKDKAAGVVEVTLPTWLAKDKELI